MMFTTWKLLAAACFFGVARALSMIQHGTEVVTLHAGGPPSLAEVEDQLGKVNDTLDKISETLDTINSTAYGLLDTFMSSTADFVEILGVLQKAADAASMLPGGKKITETATNFIDLANSSISEAQADLPAKVAELEAKIGPILPAIEKIAIPLMSEFVDAAQNVLDLYNLTDSSLVKKAKQSKSRVSRAAKKHKAHKSKRAKDGMLLLQERALRGEITSSASVSVDKSVWQKGKTNPCSKSLKSIEKANTTIGKLAEKVAEVNATGFLLLGEVLEVASGALDLLNSTVAPAVDAASALPSSVMSPVTKGLDKVLAVAGTLSSTVDEQLSTVQSMVEDAESMLSTVYSLSDTLVDAVTEAQCQGACGAKMEAACES